MIRFLPPTWRRRVAACAGIPRRDANNSRLKDAVSPINGGQYRRRRPHGTSNAVPRRAAADGFNKSAAELGPNSYRFDPCRPGWLQSLRRRRNVVTTRWTTTTITDVEPSIQRRLLPQWRWRFGLTAKTSTLRSLLPSCAFLFCIIAWEWRKSAFRRSRCFSGQIWSGWWRALTVCAWGSAVHGWWVHQPACCLSIIAPHQSIEATHCDTCACRHVDFRESRRNLPIVCGILISQCCYVSINFLLRAAQ